MYDGYTSAPNAGSLIKRKRERDPDWRRCPGRRVHPQATDFFIQCEYKEGHSGNHRLGLRVWSDLDKWAIVNEQSDLLDELGKSIWRIKRAMWEES